MSKILMAILAVIMFLFTNNNTAIAAINTDCSSRGCMFVLTNTSGVLAYYADDGTSAGSLTTSVGSGTGGLSANEGYTIWGRDNSNNVWIYDIAAGGNACTRNVGTTSCSGSAVVVLGSYAYIACNASVKKVALDCSSHVSITTGSGARSIAKDDTTIYVMESDTATVGTIVPPAEISTSNSIGRQAADGMGSLVYVGGVLYTAGTAGIYTVPLPLSGTSSLLVTLPFVAGPSSANSSYLACPSWDGNVAYLVPIASPNSYISVGCTSCGWAALTNDSLYTVGGWNPDIGVKAWDFTGVQRAYSPLTTATSYTVAYAPPTVVAPFCGDGTKNGTEICDGADLSGSTCNSLGFDYGTLACNAGCTAFDTTGCHMNCGNGSIEAPEDCDGSNLNGATCTSLGFDSGTLACTGTCTFDTTACVTDTCGNGQIDNGEDCDGTNLNGATCQSLGHDAGSLSCSSTSCTFDTSACTDIVCGNGQIEGTEECDGVNLGGATCQSLGLGTGTLSCNACSYNTSGCSVQPICGNGVQEAGEECDDNNLVSGDGCDENCNIETPPTCGNGVIDTDEDCDGDNLDGQTCVGLGFTGGNLACNACSFNTAGCTNNPVCDYSGVLEEVTNVTHPDLTGNALEKYNANVQAMSRSCQISCLDTETAQVVAPQGSYCNVLVTGTDFSVIWHIYTTAATHTTPATIRVPTDIAYTMTRFGGGHILLHDGTDVDINIGENQVVVGGTQGTAELAEFTNLHPDFQTPGNWYVIDVLSDAMVYCDPNNALNCALLAAGKNGRAIINLDALGDLTEWNLKVDDKPSCSGCSQTSGTPFDLIPLLVFIGLLGFWLRFRPMAMTSKIRASVNKRR